MRCRFFLFLLFSSKILSAQDTVYARKVITYLTSETCYGRGYLKNGLGTAAHFIASELKKNEVQPLFAGSYLQPFRFDVNTFPDKMSVALNGKSLKPGVDYIPAPESNSLKGHFTLQKKDSATYIASGEKQLIVQLKKKLTFSVSGEAADYCMIEVLNSSPGGAPESIDLNVHNKLVKNYPNQNIGAFINGQAGNDSMIVFAAHYDHLGGIGKHTFFPGGNDNASGVSVVLNLIHYYKAHPPRYKTLFLFFAGEEAGLLGSRFFTESKAIDLKKIKFLVNLDLLGTGDDGIMVVNGAILEKEFNQLQKINNDQHLVKEIKKRGKARNSDHYWFTEAGVPAFFIYTLGGTTSYHDVFDTGKALPLTDYLDVITLITTFVGQM